MATELMDALCSPAFNSPSKFRFLDVFSGMKAPLHYLEGQGLGFFDPETRAFSFHAFPPQARELTNMRAIRCVRKKTGTHRRAPVHGS